jgi:hypothetical protein
MTRATIRAKLRVLHSQGCGKVHRPLTSSDYELVRKLMAKTMLDRLMKNWAPWIRNTEPFGPIQEKIPKIPY